MSDKIIGYCYKYDPKKDKYIPYPFEKGEKQQYEEKCLKIWGCIPHDVEWAKNSKLYKDEI